jgi:hypothetical protein
MLTLPSGCANTVTPEEAQAIEAQFAQDFAATGFADSFGETTRAASIPVGKTGLII